MMLYRSGARSPFRNICRESASAASAFGGAPQIGVAALGLSPALFGDPCRALERLFERQAAEAFQQRVVPGDRARHGGRIHARPRDAFHAEFVGEELRRPRGGRPPGRIQRVQFLVAGRPHQREEISADARIVLRRDVEDGTCRDRGVNGVAALPKHLEACLRRKRIARRDHAVAREHFRSPLRQPSLRPRAGGGVDRSGRRWLIGGRDAKRIRRLRGAAGCPHGDARRGDEQGKRSHRRRRLCHG